MITQPELAQRESTWSIFPLGDHNLSPPGEKTEMEAVCGGAVQD